MTGGLRNAQQAQMSAESALRAAEWRLWTMTSNVGGRLDCLNGSVSTDDGCVIYNPANPPYGTGGDVTKFRTAQGWVSGVGHAYKGPNNSMDPTATSMGDAMLAEAPVYVIEDLGPELPSGAGSLHESGDTGTLGTQAGTINTHVYRITARATGGSPNTVRVLQSTFDAQANN
jgi:type IV pilus assembly protein PilX